jgi:type II secretory pathway component PulF
MSTFRFTGTDASGARLVELVSAASLEEAIAQLSQRDCVIHSLEKLSDAEALAARRELEVDAKVEQSLVRIRRAVPAIEATLMPSFPRHLRRRMARSFEKLRTAKDLKSLVADRDTAPFVPLMLRYEDSEGLSQGLTDYVFTLLQAQNETWRRWKSLGYPLLVTVLALIFVIVTSRGMAPFMTMTREFGLRVPTLTAWVFSLVDQAVNNPWGLLISVVGLLVSFYSIFELIRRFGWDSRLLGAWVAGTSGKLQAMARLVDTLAELLNLGLSPAKSIEMAGQASGSYYFLQSAKQLAAEWREFGTMHVASDFLPPMVAVALQSVNNEHAQVQLLREIAFTYRERRMHRTEWWLMMLPVIGIVLAGVFVFVCVIACFAPALGLLTSLG